MTRENRNVSAVRVLQEDWEVFRNLNRNVNRFTQRTGIPVEARLGGFPEYAVKGDGDEPYSVELWELTKQSFWSEDPIFDLVCADEVQLHQAAKQGWVEPLDDRFRRDGLDLDDFEPAAIDAVSLDGVLYGHPYVHVANVLIYRRDLFERYNFSVPQTMAELTEVARGIQSAARSDGLEDFYGITLRGAPSTGLNFWILCSSWGPAWGVNWYAEDGRPLMDTPELRGALEHYVDILSESGPPQSATMGFKECMNLFQEGRAAMVIEPANEASTIFAEGGPVAEGTRTALVPSGPLGSRHPGLYCPPYAIPVNSKNKDAAWELMKFLCEPEQLSDDAEQAGLVEVARNSVLNDEKFASLFPSNLVETTRMTRPLSKIERPMHSHGHAVGDIIGEEAARALGGQQSVSAALQNAQARVEALGPLEWRWEPRAIAGK